MKLHFHGASYEHEPTILEAIETGITAQFRGAEYQVRRPQELPAAASQQLVYRGVPYCTDGTAIPNRPTTNQFITRLIGKLGLQEISQTWDKATES